MEPDGAMELENRIAIVVPILHRLGHSNNWRRKPNRRSAVLSDRLSAQTVLAAVMPVDATPARSSGSTIEPRAGRCRSWWPTVCWTAPRTDSIRDTVIKAALDEPRAVIVDVNRLSAPSASAWTVFTSARWHVSVWPDVPILLVCAQPKVRRAITAGGVPRYVPVHATRELALDAVHGQSLHLRRRAHTELPRSRASLGFARAVCYRLAHQMG